MEKLNEINQVVILAAGRSRRMESLSKNEPKCLLPYMGERVLERLVRQIKATGVKRIVITTGYRADVINALYKDDPIVETVENTMYEEDVNIYSMSLALTKIDGPCVIFEADTLMEDALVNYVVGSDFEGKSVWFTRGKFHETQYGGILKSDKYANIKDIRIVASYQEKYRGYEKLSGIMRVGPNEIELFKALVNKYARTTVKQYFLNAWIENIKLLPAVSADISMFEFFTFNKPEEYYQVQGKEIGFLQECPQIELLDVNGLRHIEEHDAERVENLKKIILEENTWRVPIIVEKNNLVLDGQHRLEVAKTLGYSKIPAIRVSYDDVKVWTLRKEITINSKNVIRYVKQGGVYPYKTVKHKFKFVIPQNLEIPLEDLEN